MSSFAKSEIIKQSYLSKQLYLLYLTWHDFVDRIFKITISVYDKEEANCKGYFVELDDPTGCKADMTLNGLKVKIIKHLQVQENRWNNKKGTANQHIFIMTNATVIW